MECLWKNFGGSIEMFHNAIVLCPDTLWEERGKFYYISYHTAIFLDYYLAAPVRDFHPVLPYILADPASLPPEAIDDVLPERPFSKSEVTSFVWSCRHKCKNLIRHATVDELMRSWVEEDEIALHGLCPATVEDYSLLEILFYNFRHVQHHAAQLNYILRQKAGRAAEWVSQARIEGCESK